MARSIWTGSISFGLVNIPVKLFSAVRSHDVAFHQYGPKGERIKYKRVSEKTGKEVEYSDIKKGIEVDDGSVVLLDSDELKELEPRATRTIDIEDFVDLADIDPVYFDHTYYLGPASSEGGPMKAYSLLMQAVQKQEKVGIGKVVIRGKQYLAAIRPFNGVLGLSTMLFADEVLPAEEIDELPTGKIKDGASDREVKMATQIINSLSTDWDPSRYKDTYTDQVKDYIDKKAKGEDVVLPEEPEESADVVDLMAALEASLAEARKGGGAEKSSGTAKKAAKSTKSTKKASSKAKKAPAKKTAAKKSA